jgi:hypothetical protein
VARRYWALEVRPIHTLPRPLLCVLPPSSSRPRTCTSSHCCPATSSLSPHCGQNDPELKRRGVDPLDEARRQLLAEEDAAKAAQAADAAGDGDGAMDVDVAEEDQGPLKEVKEVKEVDTARAELERLRIAEETAAAAQAAQAAQAAREAEEAAATKAREEERARARAEHEERARRDQVVAESFALFKQVPIRGHSSPRPVFPSPVAAVHAC